MDYNVAELFKTAFGINQPIYVVNTDEQEHPKLTYDVSTEQPERPKLSYSGIQTLPDYYEPDGTSWMGTPIMFSGTFKGGTYKQYDDRGNLILASLNDFQLPPTTLFSFRRAKNVTRTNVLGSNGTVKEIYGFDDWTIDVKGIALDNPNSSAAEQIEELLKWERLADSIKISGSLFNQRRIDRVVISDWSDNIQQGSVGVIPFSFQLYSDDAIELII